MSTIQGVFKSRVRNLISALLAVFGLVTIIPAFSGVASAHHAEGSASVNCAGVISYTAVAWAGSADNPNTQVNEYVQSRTNTNVRVRVVITAGGGVAPADQFGAFNSGNSYSFSGTFQWPVGATAIDVRIVPLANWANGVAPGATWIIHLTPKTNCGTTTTTTTHPSTTTTTTAATTTTTAATTTTTAATTTTTTAGTTTTTTAGTTTTTAATTTTTDPAVTTTTLPGTTTTTTVHGTTTTIPTGTLPDQSLPSTGGGSSQPTLSIAFGLACIGTAMLLSRPRLPRRWRGLTG